MPEETLNPYAPPQSEVEPPAPIAQVSYAGKGKRFLNFIIDSFIYQGITRGLDAAGLLGGANMGFLVIFGMMLALQVTYHFLNELCGGRGISKLITGTRAEMRDGSPLTIRGAFLRSLCRLIPFEGFSFMGDGPTGWHDRIPGTRVVNVRRSV